MNNITFGDEEVGYYETVAGGSGAVSVIIIIIVTIIIWHILIALLVSHD